jgi:TolB-like protein/DNA-binding SARP family transcriptional activator
MESPLQLNVLGRFELKTDGESVGPIANKAQAMLAFLAVENDRASTRERVATLLWGRRSDDRARHNVRQALSAIGRTCESLVASDGDTLSIDLANCAVDVVEFARTATSDDPEILAGCLNLYRGDLLDGYQLPEPEFEEWLRDARERLRATACQAMDRLAQTLMAANRTDEAIETLGRRLMMDSACEPAHRHLMELFTSVGRRSDALRQYQACVDALERELGAEPSAETKTAYETILNVKGLGDSREAPHFVVTPLRDGEAPMVAVLPFDNLSAQEDTYFADGITEDITTALSCFHSVQVIARGSAFIYRGRDVPEREITAALGAQFLVRGSVQRIANRVRVNVQLLDGTCGLNLWGQRYDRELADVFEVQDEITSTVVSTLAGRVEATQLARARTAPIERLEAYDLLLRGKDHHHRFTAEDCATCIDIFAQAIEKDPTYAVAHAWLACGLGQAMVWRLDEHAKLVDRSQAAAERGLELDENESECHRILAQVFLTRGDLRRSLHHQERALSLNPNDDRSVCSMGEILTFAGRPKEAEEWVRQSLRLNPYHPQRYWTHLARALLHLERFDEALSTFDKIGRPRIDDLAYSVAASMRIGEPSNIQRTINALLTTFPEFDAASFIDSLPYERPQDRDLVRCALEAANLTPTN